MQIDSRKRIGPGLFLCTLAVVTLMTSLALVDSADAEMELDGRSAAGTAIVEVVSSPTLCNGGRLRFTGIPAGDVVLEECDPGEPVPRRLLTSTNVAPGARVATLASIDASITQLGYRLTDIRCNDRQSQRPSTGNVATRRATFGIENGETVTCTFVLSIGPSCLCPKEGRWNVKNHTGQMACTGAFSLTTPLKASTTRGTIKAQDECSTLIAEGMTDDEATITFRRTPECDYKGSVGGQQGPIPMTINFTLEVENDERMTGKLTSTVSQQGATCNMNRTYEMDFQSQ